MPLIRLLLKDAVKCSCCTYCLTQFSHLAVFTLLPVTVLFPMELQHLIHTSSFNQM